MSSIQSENIEPSKSEISWLNHFYDNSLPPNYNINYYNVLIIGQEKSGKSSVMDLFKSKDYEKSPLNPFFNFRHTNADSEENDSACLLNIWALDSDINRESLVEVCLTPRALINEKCAIVFLVDLSKPYNIFNFLNNWIECISRRLENMNINVPEMVVDDDNLYLPLINRIPIIILGNQNDVMESVFQSCQYPLPTCMVFQYQLRSWAIKYNSSILFISCKTGENANLFKSYLSNIALNTSVLVQPNFESNKSLFIPFNCDSQEKIEEFGSKIPYLDISGPLSQYFDLSHPKDDDSFQYLKYQAMDNDNLKSMIDECFEGMEKNKRDTSISNANIDILNNKIVADKTSEIKKINKPSLDELESFMDTRAQI